MLEPLNTKAKMYRAYYAGRLGNKPRTWQTLDSLLDDDYRGLVSLRSLEISNPVRLYHIPFADLTQTLVRLRSERGITHDKLTYVEAPDDTARTIQGEYDGYHLTYSYEPLPMRLAFDKNTRHASGTVAKMYLQHYLEPVDYEWLRELLTLYPDHTIEFSGFTRPVGILKTKMLVWEVRAY